MDRHRPNLSTGAALAAGLILGTVLGGGRGRVLEAGGGDRPDAAIVSAGAIGVERNPQLEVQVDKDAVYYLNYSKGRLLAAVPLQRQTAAATQVLSEFAETDLVRDFRLAPGTNPHFTMTPGRLGISDGQGAAVLYVFETTTGQLGIYRAEASLTASSSRPLLRLLERKSDARLAHSGTVLAKAP